LRFPSFKSKWEKNYFKDELDLLKNNTLSRAELNYKSGKIKNIHYGDILVKFENSIYSNSKEIPYINEEYIPKNYKSMLLKSGDLIIADTAEDYTVGKSVEIINNDENMVISGLHTIPCRAKQNNFSLGYLGYYTNSPSFHNQLLPLIQGIKVSSISKSQIKETYISYPEKDEQEKIVNFLALVNSRIHTQSKIIEQIKSQIKSISHIMCKVNNDTVKLKEVCVFENKTNHQSGEGLSSGKYVYFTNEEETTKYFNSYDFDGEYIIANTGGKANFKYYNGKFATMSDCLVIKCSKIVEPKFILYVLLNFIEKINHIGFVGSGLKHLDKDWFENMSIPQYSSIHDKYLNLINTLALKLDKEELLLKKLKEQKKYLLSNMFI